MLQTGIGAACCPGKEEVAHLNLELRCLRPSLGDGRFTGDAWIIDQGDGTLALLLGDYELARIAALPFDAPSLNQILDRVWSRRARRRR